MDILKMRKKRVVRAQAAMEFLLTYGWAILVVLVVIAALAYFGVLDPTKLLPSKCYFGGGIGNCDDYMLIYDIDPLNDNPDEGVVWIRLNNYLGNPIKTASLSIESGAECSDLPFNFGHSVVVRMKPDRKGTDMVDALLSGETLESVFAQYAWLIPAAGTYQETDFCPTNPDLCSTWSHGEQANIIAMNCKGLEKGKRETLVFNLEYSFSTGISHFVSGTLSETAQELTSI